MTHDEKERRHMRMEKYELGELLTELRRLEVLATPGLWEHDGNVIYGPDGDSVAVCHGNIGHYPEPIAAENDACFIAFVRNNLPALIDHLNQLVATPRSDDQARVDVLSDVDDAARALGLEPIGEWEETRGEGKLERNGN
jgi:hypothetical protein